jgi:hypothetical protein
VRVGPGAMSRLARALPCSAPAAAGVASAAEPAEPGAEATVTGGVDSPTAAAIALARTAPLAAADSAASASRAEPSAAAPLTLLITLEAMLSMLPRCVTDTAVEYTIEASSASERLVVRPMASASAPENVSRRVRWGPPPCRGGSCWEAGDGAETCEHGRPPDSELLPTSPTPLLALAPSVELVPALPLPPLPPLPSCSEGTDMRAAKADRAVAPAAPAPTGPAGVPKGWP